MPQEQTTYQQRGASQEQRVPPQDTQAEQSLLGSILLDKEAFFKVADIIQANDFYDNSHAVIFQAMELLAEKNRPIDILTVSAYLKRKKQLDDVGGDTYLTKLTYSVPSAMNISHYADIVYHKSVMRSLINISYKIGELGYVDELEVDDLIDQAEQYMFTIAKRSSQAFGKMSKEVLQDAFARIERLSSHKGEVRGLSTGFSGLDQMLSGLQKSDLIILAARPSLGKSALAIDIARNVAIKNKVPVGIFSLEMSTDQIVDRMISATAHTDLWKIRTGKKLVDQDFYNIQSAMDILSTAPIFIDDHLTSSVLQMRTMARRLQSEHGLGLLVIDYLQLIQPKSKFDNLAAQVSEISRAMKSLARELEIPVLCLSQLSRDIERRGGTPKLSDLRDSGSIEQDADVVMFIQREAYSDDPVAQSATQLHIAKHRNGPIGKVELIFNRQYASFQDVEKNIVEPPPSQYENYNNNQPIDEYSADSDFTDSDTQHIDTMNNTDDDINADDVPY